ncbi:hypothetical protein ACTXON_13475 [Brachybacterium alimentarium]|uniref:hypothetical protein n=1 Tax=Brachybacterium alimentarium TaxID=47845 RepID=UPI000DF1597B|nr:hypothetical protein [Brachybacterium alimentarium]RCS92331.1 hypothetical protein CIK69_03975 [Brachybacterium alimentarium]
MERIGDWMGRQRATLGLAVTALRTWTLRQVLVAVLAGGVFAALIGVATVLIPNPVFAREVPTVPWNYPVWILTSILMGTLVATYVQPGGGRSARADGALRSDGNERGSSRAGGAAGILAWFAVGCPVCNKIALITLGHTGALTLFAPLQPFLAAIAIVLGLLAVIWRLRGQVACSLPSSRREAVSAS